LRTNFGRRRCTRYPTLKAHADNRSYTVREYAIAAERYFGREQGQAWVANLGKMISFMVRVTITPEWVGLLDFQALFPSALPL